MDKSPLIYSELHCLSHYSFLKATSSPQDLVNEAKSYGYSGLAITDECSLSGCVKAHLAAQACQLKLVIGSEFILTEGITLLVLVPNIQAYHELCQLISYARKDSAKGYYQLSLVDLKLKFCLAIWAIQSCSIEHTQLLKWGHVLKKNIKNGLWIGLNDSMSPDSTHHLLTYTQIAQTLSLPVTAIGRVLMHNPSQKELLDLLTAIRLNTPLNSLGKQLIENEQRHLKPLQDLYDTYPSSLLMESVHISDLCHFSLEQLRYEYPTDCVPKTFKAINYLKHLVTVGIKIRWPNGASSYILNLINKELTLIEELGYELYFITVYDIVNYAKSQHILCQGRGSAANSVVCYCLLITEVNPEQIDVLFERFISKERSEPPDIDIDFEHHRREQVIQYIYNKYTKNRAALCASVITYQPRSAVRDIGKALNFDSAFINQLAKNFSWWENKQLLHQRFSEAGVDSQQPIAQKFIYWLERIINIPRHLSQHVGGFIITKGLLTKCVPIENASMPDRTVIQWDKDDVNALGLLKIDVLGLGMLSAIQKAIVLHNNFYHKNLSLQSIPKENAKVYQMLQKADSIGVFQIESRAQMAMLPRLKPRCFYDLVIEVAIVRPGPIQGNMVHPYLKRRQGLEATHYPSEDIKKVLGKTLGVPIFQEQVIKLAMVAAGFSAGEADQLRRSISSFRRNEEIYQFQDKLIKGMMAKGFSQQFADNVFEQIKGFGKYGFPESHAASFALLVYISAWLKCFHPAIFCTALLNSQPMGFYSPSQLIQDARRHGVTVNPVCANHSQWDCCLEPCSASHPSPAIRLGFRLIKGLAKENVAHIVAIRNHNAFQSIPDFIERTQINRSVLARLLNANVFADISGHRYQSHWQASGLDERFSTEHEQNLLNDGILMTDPSPYEEMLMDYHSLGLTLGAHPMTLLRQFTPYSHCSSGQQIKKLSQGKFVRYAGLVTSRQRPPTANGVLFLTLEDETGLINALAWPKLVEKHSSILLRGQLLVIFGTIENHDNVIHILIGRVEDHTNSIKEKLGQPLPRSKRR